MLLDIVLIILQLGVSAAPDLCLKDWSSPFPAQLHDAAAEQARARQRQEAVADGDQAELGPHPAEHGGGGGQQGQEEPQTFRQRLGPAQAAGNISAHIFQV